MPVEICCTTCAHRWAWSRNDGPLCLRCQAPIAGDDAITADPHVPGSVAQSIQPGLPDPQPAITEHERRLLRGIMRPPQGRMLAFAAAVLLAIVAVTDAGFIVVEMHRALAIRQLLVGGAMGDPHLLTQNQTNLFNLAALGPFIAATTVVMFWLHTAYNNLSVLQVAGLNYTPAEAVGNCLIPWRWPYMPYRVIQEMWRASDPALPADSDSWKARPGSWLIRLWWVLFILRHVRININISPFPFHDRALLTTLLTTSLITAAACLLSIIAAGLFCVIMVRLQRRQWQRFERLQEMG